MRYKILSNGDLEISGKIDLSEFEFPESDNAMYDAFETLTCNGLSWVTPENVGALTDAPMLTDGDPAEVTNDTNLWWFPNYMVRSPLEDLAKTGKVIFQKVKEAV